MKINPKVYNESNSKEQNELIRASEIQIKQNQLISIFKIKTVDHYYEKLIKKRMQEYISYLNYLEKNVMYSNLA